MDKTVFGIAAAFAAATATAADLKDLADDRFAEAFAFSTNRTALVETLQPRTKAWYAYSILDAQNEKRFEEASRLIREWDAESSGAKGYAPFLARNFRDRQNFLLWEGKPDDRIVAIAAALENAGIRANLPEREVEIKPDTYPSALPPGEVSFDTMWRLCARSSQQLENGFRFLAVRPGLLSAPERAAEAARNHLPDEPGLFDSVIAYLSDSDNRHVFADRNAMGALTLDQLMEVQRRLKGTAKDVSASEEFARAVFSKIAPGADDDPEDPAVKEAVLKRRLEFARTLAPALAGRRLAAERELLDFYASRGDYAHTDLFIGHLRGKAAETKPRNGRLAGDGFIREWLEAARRAGSDMEEYRGLVEAGFFARTVAETDLLAGKPAAESGAGVFGTEEFKALQERVELEWAKTNPRVFGAGDAVSLAIDVKNAPVMSVSVYEMDAESAVREAKGAMPATVDLDCAVPTFTRTVDFQAFPAIRRHRETLDFPELEKPGLYVVECSANGVVSRAVIRKGRLRAMVRNDASGYVFSAVLDDGSVAKDAKLRLDGTVFKAEANGEIPVPFASSGKTAGRKKAIVVSGSLATAVEFFHNEETSKLSIDVALPAESLVAGATATALARPRLEIGGVEAPPGLLEKTELRIVFKDGDGRESVKTVSPFPLADSAETAIRFAVPQNLADMRMTVSGTLKRAADGEEKKLSATWSKSVNAFSKTDETVQAFLRRTDRGYVVEFRGRTGERVPSRAARFRFKHRALRLQPQNAVGNGIMLQGDRNGEIFLGPLDDIEKVFMEGYGNLEWRLCDSAAAATADSISAVEGETIEIPAGALSCGGWAGAGELASRVSLLELNRDGKITADRISACSYKDGILRIEGLKRGDYRLSFRAEGAVKTISVAKAAPRGRAAGAIAGETRELPDTGAPAMLAITSAQIDGGGILRVKLANAADGARVHVFASRTRPEETEGRAPRDVFALAAAQGAAGAKRQWGAAKSEYISGRNLGDRLRYILDRRREGGRIGNMLDKPSLLLNPRALSETRTNEETSAPGENWALPEAAMCEEAPGGMRRERRGSQSIYAGTSRTCRDFLPGPAAVFPNLEPDVNCVVELDLSSAKGLQDVEIVAFDGRTADSRSIALAAAEYEPRDLRMKPEFDALAAGGRSKTYSTVGELCTLAASIDPRDAAFAEFSFIAKWHELDDAAKREIYGRHASHELDFFLCEKDGKFFADAVLPLLKNKSRKDFIDKWLLGEDVSGYAAPGKIQELNAFEQCLLARRVKSAAPVVARILADWCEANPPDPGEEERRMSIALDEMGGSAVAGDMNSAAYNMAPQASRHMPIGFTPMPITGEKKACPPAERLRSAGGARADFDSAAMNLQKAKNRRARRQFYRPPERTKEWVETYWHGKRASDETLPLARPCRFWRDYAAAVADGSEKTFRSQYFRDAVSTFTGKMAALAVTAVPFEAEDGEETRGVTFSRGGARDDGAKTLNLVQRITDPSERDDDGSAREIKGDLSCGTLYALETILINPTARQRRARVVSQIPSRAVAAGGTKAAEESIVVVPPYGSRSVAFQKFYFPSADGGAGAAKPAKAVENGTLAGEAAPVVRKVVPGPPEPDMTSWRYVSQKGSKSDVLEYLAKKNLSGAELEKTAWRMKDGDFAEKALATLSARGVYCENLWLAGLKWKDSFDPVRFGEVVERSANVKKLARTLGPALDSPVLKIDPEDGGVFEHREYWPVINARTHSKGGTAAIANEGLAAEWRAFLDTLAAKREPSARDRLLAAVFLIAQDRVEEARRQVALAPRGGDAEMQRDYLAAYFAFSDGESEKARKLAEKWMDAPQAVWRGRFAKIVAQADEIAGRESAAKDGDAAAAPSIALKPLASGGAVEGVVVTAGNLSFCTLKAYPVDVEIGFSKNPFGGSSASGGVTGMKPKWTADVEIPEDGEKKVSLPRELRKTNLVLVASGADGRAEERLEITPGSVDVQLVREYRQIRARDAKARPVPGAYVKVYARCGGTGETKFHKDGYTDLRGAFDYASVSTDSDSRPSEYAIFVDAPGLGVKILRVGGDGK